jgi:serine phosphatase RsbU (regulator of sigma subunit)
MPALPAIRRMRTSIVKGAGRTHVGEVPDGTFLPPRWKEPPLRPVELHAVSRPARTFTGDFYLTHQSEEGLWLVLGDVAGKGLRAAVTMAMIQEELERRLAEEVLARCNPEEAMLRLHSFLKPILPANRFATAVIAHWRLDGRLVLANAGHCPALIARLDGSVEEIPSTGPIVGILDHPRWSAVSTRLERGEALLLYSDGVVEARSPSGEEFGSGAIHRILSSARGSASARRILEAILGALEGHSAGLREDDLTLVVARRTPAPEAC